ncbi:MAG: beta-galactosidase [Chloroflexi bacterium]|nr:beta-galactosidase [Chloroflexota bacterium]
MTGILLAALLAPASTQADGCHFILGFATLEQLLPRQVGQCLDDQTFAGNGDALQHTSGGLLVWRKLDNWTAFTDGYHTWINGPFGLQERLNSERFLWEAAGAPGSTLAGGQPGAPTPPSSARIAYGIDVNQHDKNLLSIGLDRVYQLAAQTGASYVRIGASWSQVQASGPNSYDWSYLDHVVQLATAHGLHVLLEVGVTPSWDLAPGTNGNTSAPPADCVAGTMDCASFASYMAHLASHVAPLGVQYLIVRNEPQVTGKNWVGGTPAEFAQFLHAGYVAAHQADPSIKILNGGEEMPSAQLQALAAPLDGPGLQQELAFEQALYTNPLFCSSLDVLDLHVGFNGPTYSPMIVDSSEQALQRCNGGKQVPVWVTEVAYTSIPQLQALPRLTAELGNGYTNGPASQAQFLADTYAALQHDCNVAGINWTYLVDLPTGGQTSLPPGVAPATLQDLGLGLFDENYQPKPALSTFQHIVSAG